MLDPLVKIVVGELYFTGSDTDVFSIAHRSNTVGGARRCMRLHSNTKKLIYIYIECLLPIDRWRIDSVFGSVPTNLILLQLAKTHPPPGFVVWPRSMYIITFLYQHVICVMFMSLISS